MTRTLDCLICEMPTAHAMLNRSNVHRDSAERWAYKRPSWMRGPDGAALSDPEGTIA
jgi:hypothetical protein